MKCEACGTTDNNKLWTGPVHGHTCCRDCSDEFCYRCGSYPVELLGDHDICQQCTDKADGIYDNALNKGETK